MVAIAHPQWSERSLAVVVPRADCLPDAAELRQHLATQFPKWWVPDDVVFTDALPHTATGKVRKLALRELYRDHYSPTAQPAREP